MGVEGQLRRGDRVLVLGASGWFGSTLLDMIHPDQSVLLTGNSARGRFTTWDERTVRSFDPTVVMNFAFLTPERVATDGERRFREENARLTDQLLVSAGLPQVRSVVTISSGSAVSEPESPYGQLKRAEERAVHGLAGQSRSVVIGRAFSVSGGRVRRPRDYAFSDLILQARTGEVRVAADRPTFRRYVSVTDFLTVCINHALSQWSGLIESGGELIEMGELANRIIALVNPGASVERPALTSETPSVYASDNTSWTDACTRLGYEPMALDAQISAVHRQL